MRFVWLALFLSVSQASCRGEAPADRKQQRPDSPARVALATDAPPASPSEALASAILAGYGDAADERAAIIAAAGAPEPCASDWCRDATKRFAAWTADTAGMSPRATLTPAICSLLACWSDVTSPTAAAVLKSTDVIARTNGWTGMSLIGSPHPGESGQMRAFVALVKPVEEKIK